MKSSEGVFLSLFEKTGKFPKIFSKALDNPRDACYNIYEVEISRKIGVIISEVEIFSNR